MKNINLFLCLLITIVFFNCSDDESSNDNQTPTITNQFTINGQSYELQSAFVYDESDEPNEVSEIGITLTNKSFQEIATQTNTENVTLIYFDFDDITVNQTTYNDITDYNFSVNGTVTNEEFLSGTILLTDDSDLTNLNASSGEVTINSISDTSIDLSFTFTRTDGVVISGSYSGLYQVPNLE